MSAVEYRDGESDAITFLLEGWRNGDSTALPRLIPLIYKRLHAIAKGLMRREHADHSLQPTALVNEAYLRMSGGLAQAQWDGRSHFFGLCARLMRQVLVDHARKNGAGKRGGDVVLVSMIGFEQGAPDPLFDIISLDRALDRLASLDERKAKVFELRFFSGMDVPEVAVFLHISTASVVRDWKFARAWLRKEVYSASSAEIDKT
jgi:RNA polymerase sigma-70 factor, ECF subfamily